MEQEVILEKEEGIAIITLNRPRRLNALTYKMFGEIPEILKEIRGDEGTKAVIITGAGEAFCSGADVADLGRILATTITETAQISAFSQIMSYFVSSIINLEKPTIAAINGIAAGGGFSLALLCDIRIASERARFSMAFVRRGLIPDLGATYLLPKIVGIGKAMELMLTGDIMSAQEAERIGLVNKVVPHDELMPASKELAKRLAKGPPIAMGLIKKAIYKGLESSLLQQLELEALSQVLCERTEDFKEGVKSFLEKREPIFKGR